MTDFRDLAERNKKLVVCGGGHVAIPVVRIGKMLDFTVTVLEDRAEFAENARSAGADNVICAPFEEGLAGIPGDADTFFVIVTRGHACDIQCLNAVSRKPHAYIGMIGSRRRVALVRERLITEFGCDPQVIASVHMPIGIPIGSETPAEIAVSILAEIIQVCNRKERNSVWPREIVRFLTDPARKETVALATVAERIGSAPRDEGARMLILPDGSILGTIGGGLLESRVIRAACEQLRRGEPSEQVYEAALDADAADEDGMICGGAVKVKIELIAPEQNATM